MLVNQRDERSISIKDKEGRKYKVWVKEGRGRREECVNHKT
jgi:hypothetical protein